MSKLRLRKEYEIGKTWLLDGYRWMYGRARPSWAWMTLKILIWCPKDINRIGRQGQFKICCVGSKGRQTERLDYWDQDLMPAPRIVPNEIFCEKKPSGFQRIHTYYSKSHGH